jgi:hypothetical protein
MRGAERLRPNPRDVDDSAGADHFATTDLRTIALDLVDAIPPCR